MTREELEAIRERAKRDYAAHESGIHLSNDLVSDRFALLAEVTRLRTQPSNLELGDITDAWWDSYGVPHYGEYTINGWLREAFRQGYRMALAGTEER